MLMPNKPSVTVNTAKPVAAESLAEDYGEASEGALNLGGRMDFFSSLGTEVKKKNALLERPEAPQVHHSMFLISLFHPPL